MANEAIYDLVQETALGAGDRFIVQQTDASTRATSATFALLGGLAIDTTYDTAADHADIAAAVGTLYLVDLSALASEVIFSLPTTANVGERVGVYITAGSSTDGEELAIRTTAASNDTINGVDYDSADWSRLFILGEYVEFVCVTANTAWAVAQDGRIPCAFSATLSGDVSLGVSTWTTLTFDTIEASPYGANVGDAFDTTNNRLNPRRTAYWDLSGHVRPDSSMPDGTNFFTRIRDTTNMELASVGNTEGGSTAGTRNCSVSAVLLTRSEIAEMQAFCSASPAKSADATYTAGATTGKTRFTGAERLKV